MKRLSLKYMIAEIKKCANEIAIGYNDSNCSWHINYGCRGSGNHVEGCGKYIDSDQDDFSKAIKFFYKKIVMETE